MWLLTWLSYHPFPPPCKVKVHKLGGDIVKIKEFREKTGMTQAQLADKLNVDRSIVSYWERGKATPCKKHRAMLCAILQCTEKELMAPAQ